MSNELERLHAGAGTILSFLRYLMKVVFSQRASDGAPRDILEWTSLICSNLISCSLLIEGGYCNARRHFPKLGVWGTFPSLPLLEDTQNHPSETRVIKTKIHFCHPNLLLFLLLVTYHLGMHGTHLPLTSLNPSF